ncbi:MAG: NADP-dependent phosphogluconate dehydrogenase [Candidatus Eisenbacteria bacterium]|uniref:6-phosphogluconate dehydrogenase, decarboxylating n=1 Tax=Eiseniibacteriota bacterium TaxID=2212470 RepID=A0A956RQC6_UNCEI|nr:NADP-dependent phosphogluconate dehydrogenase [Candidatus Eisenbacteria bacterium]
MQSDMGIVGLGVMGSNLARNIERNGFSVAVYNYEPEMRESFLAKFGDGHAFQGAETIPALVERTERPRRILMMIKAGAPVDSVIEQLEPHLDEGDIVIDGGNSHYPDTDRRIERLAKRGVHFVGMGVSGGEEGALHGPSLMPGGDPRMYERLRPVLEKIAAQVDSGPCVTYCGKGSAGHFVKMVHNGIEYGDMQLIAEAYDLLRHAFGLTPDRIRSIFEEWNRGELQSFLIEITARIVAFPDDQGAEGILLDRILDAAGQKGTGKWTTITALELGVPIPTITAAVDGRVLSSMKPLRAKLSGLYEGPDSAFRGDVDQAIADVRAALYASKICSYAQGFDLLQQASAEFAYGVRLDELARIWKGGCIIRAAFLVRIHHAYREDGKLANLLLDKDFREDLASRAAAWRRVVERGVALGVPTPGMAASLAYFDTLRRDQGPANLIQAQRDLFGAHTYQRTDREGTFHTHWD